MINLTSLIGLDIKMKENGELIYGDGLKSEPVSIRTPDKARTYFMDPKAKADENLYYMYRNTALNKDRDKIKSAGFRFDVTVIPPGHIGDEYIKTIGIEQIDLSEIYQITNNISKNVSDSIYLKKGIEWCDYLTSKKFQIPEVTLVKARIYKKLGNNIKANEFAQFALTEEKKKTSPRIKEYQNFINELEKQTKKQ